MITAEHNLTTEELIAALTGLALAESIDQSLIKALRSTQRSREPVRERYLDQLMREFRSAGTKLDQVLADNVDRLLVAHLSEPLQRSWRPSMLSGWLRRNKPARLLLSQAQIDELLLLIRQHYRIAIRAGGARWEIDPATERRWKNLGVLRPDVRIAGIIGDAFVAGRLAQVLEDGASLADMRRMARELPMTREASLTLQATTDRVGFDLAGGPGYRAEQIAGQLVLGANAQAVNDIVTAYRQGQLQRTPTNRADLTPAELEQLQAGPVVEGWRQLGRELRNRMAATDRERDWERVAVSATRMAANIGAISAMAEQGVEELYYDVHPDACAHCKRLYLDSDGNPKIFRVGQLVDTITSTGGANYDRKVDEWLPNALAHPWCQCRPKRRLAQVAPKGRKRD